MSIPEFLNHIKNQNIEELKKGIETIKPREEFLREACRTKNLEIIKLLLDHKHDIFLNNDDIEHPRSFAKFLPLKYAIVKNDLEMVKLFLQYTSDINLGKGRTVIDYANYKGYYDIAKYIEICLTLKRI